METISLIFIGVWLIKKLFGDSSFSIGELSNFEKYKNFERMRKK